MKRAGFPDVAVLAASCAVMAGAIESATPAFRRIALNQIAFVSYDFIWLTPAAYLVAVVPATLALYGLSATVGRPFRLHVLLGLLVTALSFAVLLPHTKVAWWAWGVVAVGLGLQASRRAGSATNTRWLNRLAMISVAVAVVAAATGITIRARRPWTSPLAPPSVARAGAPNVLLIVLDTVRSSNLSLYGYGRETTPELKRWAAEGVVFEKVLTVSPWTLPSHASMFTGRGATEIQASWRLPLADGTPTITESFRQAGYATAGFVSNLLYTSYESGLTQGFSHYDDYRLSWPLLLRHSSFFRMNAKSTLPQAHSFGDVLRALLQSHIKPDSVLPADVFRPADKVATAFLDWQASTGNRPFYAFLNLFDAHGPYRSPDGYRTRFASTPKATTMDKYDASIAFLDHVISEVLTALQQRGVLDQTIVVITSDHGEHFGEHDLTGHANSLYLPLLHVPLIIRYPGVVPAATRVDGWVTLSNLARTLADLAGVSNADVPGTSLAARWRSPAEESSVDLVATLAQGINVDEKFRNSRGDMYSRLDEQFHYIRNGDGTEELYDHRTDPGEQNNLINDPARAAVLTRLRTAPAVR